MRGVSGVLFYLCPYLLIISSGFGFKTFICYMIFVILFRRIIVLVVELARLREQRRFLKAFNGKFHILKVVVNPFERGENAYNKWITWGMTRFIARVSKSSLVLLVDQYESYEYFSSYACYAGAAISTVLVSDELDDLLSDENKLFFLFHELGHTDPGNMNAFSRPIFEFSVTCLFVPFLFITNPQPVSISQILTFFTILFAFFPLIFHFMRSDARLSSEILADNRASNLAYCYDKSMFQDLPGYILPNDRLLSEEQNSFRRRRLAKSIAWFNDMKVIEPMVHFTYPKFAIALANVLMYLLFWQFVFAKRPVVEGQISFIWPILVWIVCYILVGIMSFNVIINILQKRSGQYILEISPEKNLLRPKNKTEPLFSWESVGWLKRLSSAKIAGTLDEEDPLNTIVTRLYDRRLSKIEVENEKTADDVTQASI